MTNDDEAIEINLTDDDNEPTESKFGKRKRRKVWKKKEKEEENR